MPKGVLDNLPLSFTIRNCAYIDILYHYDLFNILDFSCLYNFGYFVFNIWLSGGVQYLLFVFFYKATQ